MDDNKAKALAAALQQIEKQFGKGSIMRMGEAEIDEGIQVVSTGSLGLDIALGVGGLPRGRVVEIYGPESSGKTTLCLQVVAEMQKLGGVAAFIDAEHALDPQYAQKLGVHVGDLLISQPDTGEQALEIADMLVRSGSVDIIVVDNASRDGSVELVATEFPQVHLVASPDNLGYTGGNNLALNLLGFHVNAPAFPAALPLAPQPSFVLLLNADTEIVGDALWQMATFLQQRPTVGVCGANLRYGDGRFQHGAFAFPSLFQVAPGAERHPGIAELGFSQVLELLDGPAGSANKEREHAP